MALSSYKYALIAPRLEKVLAQNAAPKVPKWHSYGKFRKVTVNPHFYEKVERGDQGKFLKNRLKSSPCLKGPKAHWRMLNYTLIKMHLKCKDWRRFWRKQRLQNCQNGQVRAIIASSPKTGIFLEKCKGGTKGNFSKIAQKVALV